MSFEWPLALLGLLAVPAAAALWRLADRRRAASARAFANPALLPNLVVRPPRWRRQLPAAILLAALAALVVGVARPHATVSIRRQEAAVVLAVDSSRSMGATDVRPTRLDAARAGAEAFLKKVPAPYRVALVSIGSHAVVSVPPTGDRSLVENGLSALHPGEGTALGDAIALAAALARHDASSDGVVPPTTVLLFSDGAPDGGVTSLQKAVAKALAAHVPVNAVALGTPDGIVRRTLVGGFQELVHVPAQPDTLHAIAQATGGEFFTSPSDPRLRDVYARLAPRLGSHRESRELGDAFAGAGALLLLAGGGLSGLWFRRVLP